MTIREEYEEHTKDLRNKTKEELIVIIHNLRINEKYQREKYLKYVKNGKERNNKRR